MEKQLNVRTIFALKIWRNVILKIGKDKFGKWKIGYYHSIIGIVYSRSSNSLLDCAVGVIKNLGFTIKRIKQN